MQYQVQIKLFKNEQQTCFIHEWRCWWSTLAGHLFLVFKVSRKKLHFQGGYVILYNMKAWELQTAEEKSTNMKPSST